MAKLGERRSRYETIPTPGTTVNWFLPPTWIDPWVRLWFWWLPKDRR